MVFDPRTFIDAIEQAAQDAVDAGLHQVAERARHKAPVRNVFRDRTSRKRRLRGQIGVLPAALNEVRGPAFARAGRTGFEIQRIGEVAGSFGAGRTKGRFEVTDRRISGRTNSFAPVVMSPAGRVGGESLRHLSARGVLKVQEIAHPGGRFSAFDLLSGRGRYELEKGRADFTNPETGETTLGGTLRGSIKVEGPFVGRGEVYGFVSAAAFNEQGFNYALAQEIGTAHNRPQPYLRPALRELHEKIAANTRNAFSTALKNARSTRRRDDRGFRRTLKLRVDIVGFEKLGET